MPDPNVSKPNISESRYRMFDQFFSEGWEAGAEDRGEAAAKRFVELLVEYDQPVIGGWLLQKPAVNAMLGLRKVCPNWPRSDAEVSR